MAFDYILDLFGKNRHRNTRFTDVEKRAKETISNFVAHQIDDETMFNEMLEIQKEYSGLLEHDGQITIDEDTPLWMNSFLGFQFKKWSEFQILKKHFADHPEKLVGEMKARYQEICDMGYDRNFMQACITVLNNTSGE
ncbi:MAG: hypothetical protein ACI4B3_09230 [Prevotella sp.]